MPPKRKPQAVGPRPRKSLKTAAKLAAAAECLLQATHVTQPTSEVSIPPSEFVPEPSRLDAGKATADSNPDDSVLVSFECNGPGESSIAHVTDFEEGDRGILNEPPSKEKVKPCTSQDQNFASGSGEMRLENGVDLGCVVKKKKIVRIVKRIVKKRMPKGFQNGLVPCSSKQLETQKVVSDGNSNATSPFEVNSPNLYIDKAACSSLLSDDALELRRPENPTGDKMVVDKVDIESVAEKSMNINLSQNDGRSKYDLPRKEKGGAAEEVEAEKKDNVNLSTDGKPGNDNLVLECKLSTEVVAVSWELEALERQKRRKTEIFVGGVDKEATKEDLRKAFEESGEIVEIKLVMNAKTGKNKGFGFVRFASSADATTALKKYSRVEICGKQCTVAAVEGNDTLFLGNIDKKWKNEDVIKILLEIGIERIDNVTVIVDPKNAERNRGFAFLELKTNKDAQYALKKLQMKDVSRKLRGIKAAWAEPLIEPDEDSMLKVKSVYAEYLPGSWDEENIRRYFEKFGDIENVMLSQNPLSSRNDFAFVKFRTREAALACIESFNQERSSNDGSEVLMHVSLAKPLAKGKPRRKFSKTTNTVEICNSKRTVMPYQSRSKSFSTIGVNVHKASNKVSSTEIEQLLAQQASFRQVQPRFITGSPIRDGCYSLPQRKHPHSAFEDNIYNADPRGYPRTHYENSFPVASRSYSNYGSAAGMASLPYYHQQSASGYGHMAYASGFQVQKAPYLARNNVQYRYQL